VYPGTVTKYRVPAALCLPDVSAVRIGGCKIRRNEQSGLVPPASRRPIPRRRIAESADGFAREPHGPSDAFGIQRQRVVHQRQCLGGSPVMLSTTPCIRTAPRERVHLILRSFASNAALQRPALARAPAESDQAWGLVGSRFMARSCQFVHLPDHCSRSEFGSTSFSRSQFGACVRRA